MKKKKNPVSNILFCLSLLCVVCGIVVLIWALSGRKKSGALISDELNHTKSESVIDNIETIDTKDLSLSDSESNSISETVSTDESKTDDLSKNQPEDDLSKDQSEDDLSLINSKNDDLALYENSKAPDITFVENPYKDYFLQNSDMIGWLKIPDTIVDYPVMWTPENETYYLFLDFNKKKSGNGCLLLDTDSSMDPLTTNLIIHGHNNPNAMFGNLDKYEDEKYKDEHPYIYLFGKDYEHKYEVVAAFRSKVFYKSDVCFKYYKFFEAETEAEFNDYIDNVKALSYYDTKVPLEFGDHLLTLSTCSYHVENGRFVLVAKELEPENYYEPFDISADRD